MELPIFLKVSFIFRQARLKMYSADDGNTEVFYFKNATATFSSFAIERH